MNIDAIFSECGLVPTPGVFRHAFVLLASHD
jgi:hypothetical protein